MAPDELPTERQEIELDLPPGQEAEEGTLDRRTVNTPSRQGATIPQGWKPSINKPVPVVRCSYVFKDEHPRGGEQCNRWSLRGSLLCYTHSGRGNLKNVETYRQAILEAARLRLTESVPDAMEGLIDLAANSGADNVRLKAITEILDRAGIKTADEFKVDVEISGTDPMQALSDRLSKLQRGAEAAAAMQVGMAARAAAAAEAAEDEQLAIPYAVDAAADSDEIVVIDGEVEE